MRTFALGPARNGGAIFSALIEACGGLSSFQHVREQVALVEFQGVAHLFLVGRAIVDARNGRNAASHVIEDALDDVWSDSELGKVVANVRRKSCSVQPVTPLSLSSSDLGLLHA